MLVYVANIAESDKFSKSNLFNPIPYRYPKITYEGGWGGGGSISVRLFSLGEIQIS